MFADIVAAVTRNSLMSNVFAAVAQAISTHQFFRVPLARAVSLHVLCQSTACVQHGWAKAACAEAFTAMPAPRPR
jgi:hypothetical protein